MTLTRDKIVKEILNIPFVKQIYYFEQGEFFFEGKIEIAFAELENNLDFEIKIAPHYPLKCYGTETIVFSNKNLIQYKHVMGDGSICIHTSHNTDLAGKLYIDFNSLKSWIIKYYINKDEDLNYEHVIVNPEPIDDKYHSYCFDDCDKSFKKGEFGEVDLSMISTGKYKGTNILNFLVKDFKAKGNYENSLKKCSWSNLYEALAVVEKGFYFFTEDTPARFNKFIFTNWLDLSQLLPVDFLNILHRIEKDETLKNKGRIIPLFLGYRINSLDTHWQVAMLKLGDFPLSGEAERENGIKTGKWNTKLKDEKIVWSLTRNVSYRYFFGRGCFCEELTNKKILIIGVGAIGSIIAKTLTRGGCRHIDFVDYDTKEPENVCRSEYLFSTGIRAKTEELELILSQISPFLNINILNGHFFEGCIKTIHNIPEKGLILKKLNDYDLIFDCSTDNDLMYLLDILNLNSTVINISITNKAKELVCATSNIYKFVNNQFSNILNNETDDLYSPTGCWSPTFKASYNDIDVLVQLALKRINRLSKDKIPLNNFVIQEDNENIDNFKIIEY